MGADVRPPPPEADVAVVGAGIVGLACAAALARAGRSVVAIERREGIARETSSRNSEVIHAGIYYPPRSLKATLCTRGRDLVYARCRERRIPHRRLGKLIVASEPAEVAELERLAANARANGVPDLALVDGAQARALEPDVRAEAALHSPHTGIVDAHALALSFAAEAEAHAAALVLRAEVIGFEPVGERHGVVVRDADGGSTRLACAAVVNAAGLQAHRIAQRAGIDVEALGWCIHPCKGDYFALAPGAPLRLGRLLYPLPTPGGPLGVHTTLDLAGSIRLGPDAEYVERPRYDVDPAKAELFAAAARRYLPAMRAEWLSPAYAGVRPRLAGPGEAPRDFVVAEASDLGLPGWVNLIGIESPGLTAAPAIAERVCQLLASL